MSVLSSGQSESVAQTVSVSEGRETARGLVAWSSLLFAVLQSICTFFVATAGLRLLIGASSLVISASAASFLVHLHATRFRLPMVILALLGALLNLVVIRRIRRLRNRPAAQWRQTAVAPSKLRMERLEIVLAWATLLLVAVEEGLHFHFHHFF